MSDPRIHHCCTFRIGDACFALPADGVVEVLRGGGLARVPLAPEGVRGLVHLRGRIVPVVDPAAQLGVSRVAPERATHLVIALQDDWYGLVIDEMLDVVEIPADRVEQAATPTTESSGDALIGVFAAPDRLVHLLDPQRMIHSLTRLRPQAPERQGVSHGRS
ncbi:MAG: chemotaxis protein CheW [Planctomycetes bacterium]|nr:chemotaxis protein CheW [Planctomycetota bacterium]